MCRVSAMKWIVLLTGLSLAGCAMTTPYAVYKHPVTGDVLECEQSPSGGGVVGAVAGTSYYAQCKTTLEQRGYVREGTVNRAPTATSASETATPRPAPRSILQNTAAQDLAWERWKKCSHFRGIRLKEIKTNGDIWVWVDEGGEQTAWRACDSAARAEQTRAAAKANPSTTVTAASASTGKARSAAPQPARVPDLTVPDPPTTALAAQSRTPSTVVGAMPTSLSADVPTWRPGYEWEYRWETPRGKGTFVWSVKRLDVIDGIEYFVVGASEGREIYWRKHDRAYYMDAVPGGIETRHVPPTPAPWPLVVGKSWEWRYTRERPTERTTSEEIRACKVEKQEQVVVPAGTFATLKIVCSDPRSGKVMLEVWWSPEARQYVKERTTMSYGIRDRELLRYWLDDLPPGTVGGVGQR